MAARILPTLFEAWQPEFKHGFAGGASQQMNFTAVLLGDAAAEGQAEAGPILLARADERIEQGLLNARGNARAVIRDAHDDAGGHRN